MGRLQNRVAIITGAGQGIGAAYAKAMAKEGARVVVTDIGDTSSCVDEINAQGHQAIGMKVDVTSNDDLTRLVRETEAAYGPVEILVNNAGMFANLKLRPFWEIPDEEWDQVMKVNVRGIFQAAKAIIPSMERNGRGKIVNISSSTFFLGPPGFLHYVASKAAVIGLTRSMARELGAKNITVNALAPGFTQSEGVVSNPAMDAFSAPNRAQRTIQRDMLPDDLLGTMIYLTSPDSDFMTGQTINVDGGKMMW
ncbi:MAG: SDR family oxidoreductase [Alphaproteobacteria bacterium]|nr:SDR family oxidoreductase [Alphaproteobacteria bacterium]